MTLCVATAWGQANRREPHIGYLYPAGGQQGSVFQVAAGGQYLRGVEDIHISGAGVRASVIEYVSPLRGNQLRDVGKHLRVLVRQRVTEAAARRGGAAPRNRDRRAADEEELPELPDHPLLRGLDQKDLRELMYLRDQLFDPKAQRNTQIAEVVLIEVTIDPNAAPGDRELRLGARTGLTNPMLFQVGTLPETCEQEPNDPIATDAKPLARPLLSRPEAAPLDLPVVMNGQVTPGDVDRFRFRAQQGQQLVIQTQARHLVPYLADAVPGWFQATLALFDSEGTELAYADDYRFHPDPVLFYEVPEDGEYELEIRDSIYRGREDFVYRISVGEQPFITGMFPLGGRTGAETVASIDGWNLPAKQLPLDTQPGTPSIRQTSLRQDGSLSNCVTYAVDNLAECDEAEPNDTVADAQAIDLPRIVNGRVARPGDVDVFQFHGRAGDEVVAEVVGRRLYSPLDSLLRLTDASGRVLEWNDDYMEKDGHLHRGTGLLTHHADSYLMARLPEDETYCVQLADAQNCGGDAYAYRLRISPPRPDFALRVTPSSIAVPAGRSVVVRVHALRKDGFHGDIQVELVGAPLGFRLHGGRIPGGHDSIRMTLTAPQKPLDKPVSLRLEGSAWTGEDTVRHPVVPSDDVMQAFLWRHLVPSQELMVAVTGVGRLTGSVRVTGNIPVQLPAGGAAVVRIWAPRRPVLRHVKLELNGAPDGVSIQNVSVVPGGLNLILKADADAPQVGYVDNLIVETSIEIEPKGKQADSGVAKKKRRVSLGVLPAIPFEIVRR